MKTVGEGNAVVETECLTDDEKKAMAERLADMYPRGRGIILAACTPVLSRRGRLGLLQAPKFKEPRSGGCERLALEPRARL